MHSLEEDYCKLRVLDQPALSLSQGVTAPHWLRSDAIHVSEKEALQLTSMPEIDSKMEIVLGVRSLFMKYGRVYEAYQQTGKKHQFKAYLNFLEQQDPEILEKARSVIAEVRKGTLKELEEEQEAV